MLNINFTSGKIEFGIDRIKIKKIGSFFEKNLPAILMLFLTIISIYYFNYFYFNQLGLAYNDARSHLDIGRRVVEGLKPGIAQLGSVWLPLTHVVMIPFVWNDFFWHTGLAGAINSMISFVGTGLLIYLFLKNLGMSLLARLVGVAIFVLNINILYLQSTAMTELLLIVSTTAAVYYLLLWSIRGQLVDIIKSAFWVMFASLVRYDGWFLFVFISGIIFLQIMINKGEDLKTISWTQVQKRYKHSEGMLILFCTLSGLGIGLWFLWNQLIFSDPLFFAFGPYSAHAQQLQLEGAGNLITKHNLWMSIKTYFYALFYNSNTFIAVLGFLGSIFFWLDKRFDLKVKLAVSALWGPLLFNIIALYFGHSVLFIAGINGNTWFNARYGVLLVPTIAIFVAYLFDRIKGLKITLIGLLVFLTFFSFSSFDAVTIDDARVGSSQKNVTEVAGWLKKNAKEKEGFVLISAASHDAIIFSSSLPMKKFIHEGTGKYWQDATGSPDRWARWIIMRTYDDNDSVWKLVKDKDGFGNYKLIEKYPFADIYQLKEEKVSQLNTKPIYQHQK